MLLHGNYLVMKERPVSPIVINQTDLDTRRDLSLSDVQRYMPPLVDVGGILIANFEFMKILPALDQVRRALERGDLRSGELIVESTSGNFGMGLSRAWSLRGMHETGRFNPLTLVTYPGGLPPPLDQQLEALGVKIDIVTKNINGSYQITRLCRLAEILEEESQRLGRLPFWPEQYDNPEIHESYFPLGHYVARHAQEFYGRPPDIYVNAVGTGASADGVARILREYNPDLLCACVDPQGSVVLGRRQLENTTLLGSGGMTKCRNTDYYGINDAHWIDRDQAFYQMDRLREMGVSVGYSCGGAFHVGAWYQRLFPGKLIFVLGADLIDRYLSDYMTPDCRRKRDIVAQDLPDPEVIDDPNVFTKPAHGWGWQTMKLTREWQDSLTQVARKNFVERRELMAAICPAIANRP